MERLTFRDDAGMARMKADKQAGQMLDKLCMMEEEAEKIKKPGIMTSIFSLMFGFTLILGLIVAMKFLLGLLF